MHFHVCRVLWFWQFLAIMWLLPQSLVLCLCVNPVPKSQIYFLLLCAYVYVKSLQSCSTLCNTMDCSPPGSSVYGILQAGILAGVAVPSSRGSPPPRDGIHLSCRLHSFTVSATWEAPLLLQFAFSWSSMKGFIQYLIFWVWLPLLATMHTDFCMFQ